MTQAQIAAISDYISEQREGYTHLYDVSRGVSKNRAYEHSRRYHS